MITVTNDVLAKLPLAGKDLHQYSLDAVRMFFDDAKNAAYHISTSRKVERR